MAVPMIVETKNQWKAAITLMTARIKAVIQASQQNQAKVKHHKLKRIPAIKIHTQVVMPVQFHTGMKRHMSKSIHHSHIKTIPLMSAI